MGVISIRAWLPTLCFLDRTVTLVVVVDLVWVCCCRAIPTKSGDYLMVFCEFSPLLKSSLDSKALLGIQYRANKWGPSILGKKIMDSCHIFKIRKFDSVECDLYFIFGRRKINEELFVWPAHLEYRVSSYFLSFCYSTLMELTLYNYSCYLHIQMHSLV